jgi:peptidoglycan/xylan/chitin deacetylase (PgdA/CDA1 family)
VAGLWTPAEPGDYRLEWQMLCERVAWFSDHGVVPLEREAHVVDRGPRPVAPHFPQPLTSPNHVRQRTSSGTAGVALTFDDGPDPEWTPRILERLRRLDAPATFFVLGARAAAHPRLLRRMRRDGHQIGLHGNLHLRHDEHAAEVISADTAEALSAIGGRRRTRLWRTPHGIATPDTERVAEEHGLELIHWTADTQDWQGGQTAGEMLARVEPLLRPGAGERGVHSRPARPARGSGESEGPSAHRRRTRLVSARAGRGSAASPCGAGLPRARRCGSRAA